MTDVYPFGSAETRLVRENGYGITPGSPIWRRLNGFGLILGPRFAVNPVRIPGALIPTADTVDDDFTMGSYSGRLDFNGLALVFASQFGNPAIVDLGGVPNAYQWDWLWDGRRPNRQVSYTAFYGYRDRADLCTGLIFNTLRLGGGRPDGFQVSGNVFAKAMVSGQPMGGVTNEVQIITAVPTVNGGTYTITFPAINETTAAIAFNANTATIQAAVNLLSGFNPGDVVVGGGTLPGTPATFTYGGPVFAGVNVPQLTVNSGLLVGGGSYAPSTTTPGADASVDIPVVPAGAVLGNAYLDNSWANLGNSQLLYLLNSELNFSERMGRVQPTNKSKSSDTVIDMAEQDHTLAATLAQNPVLDTQLANLRGATKVFPRLQWEGDVISGANDYLLNLDSCLQWTEMGDPENVQEAMTRPLTGGLRIDQVSGNALAIRLINTLAGL